MTLEWTNEQRFKAIVVMAAYAEKCMNDGAYYSAPGVPNLTSVVGVASEPAGALNRYIDELTYMAIATGRTFP